MSRAPTVLPPVRCFSCGKPIGHLWDQWQELRGVHGNAPDVMMAILATLGLARICCNRMFLTHTGPVAAPVKNPMVRPAAHVRGAEKKAAEEDEEDEEDEEEEEEQHRQKKS